MSWRSKARWPRRFICPAVGRLAQIPQTRCVLMGQDWGDFRGRFLGVFCTFLGRSAPSSHLSPDPAPTGLRLLTLLWALGAWLISERGRKTAASLSSVCLSNREQDEDTRWPRSPSTPLLLLQPPSHQRLCAWPRLMRP